MTALCTEIGIARKTATKRTTVTRTAGWWASAIFVGGRSQAEVFEGAFQDADKFAFNRTMRVWDPRKSVSASGS